MSDINTTDILSEKESRLAVVLFEIMQPQIRKLMIQLINENNQDLQTITDRTIDEQIDRKLDEKKSSDFDIHDYTGDIEDIVSDWISYNLTLTTTVD